MSLLVVDTSVWIDLFNNKPFPLVDEAVEESRVVLPPLVVSELYSGASSVSDQAWLDALTDKLSIFQTDLEHWRRVGQLRMILAKKGVNISTPDAHIAQCAIDVNGQLLTQDKIFSSAAKHCELKLSHS